MVFDYTRNERLFRFEEYIKTFGPKSTAEIPALIEALDYKDNRFRAGVTSALLRMMPRAREQEKEAIPLLLRYISNYNAKFTLMTAPTVFPTQ